MNISLRISLCLSIACMTHFAGCGGSSKSFKTAKSRLTQIAIALDQFDAGHNTYPASFIATREGQPLLSWRVMILKELGYDDLYNRFHLDEPWDSPHNLELVSEIPAVYQLPGSTVGVDGKSNFLGVTGDEYAFVDPKESNTARGSNIAGLWAGVTSRQVRDGRSWTVAVVVVDDDHAVVWTKPSDFSPSTTDPTNGLYNSYSGGILVGLLSGNAASIKPKVTADQWMAFFTKAGGENVREMFDDTDCVELYPPIYGDD